MDPMEPRSYKINKQTLSPSPPPAPVSHSPRQRINVKKETQLKIPPCVYHGNNAEGNTVSLDKRLAAGNKKFREFSEALAIAASNVSSALTMPELNKEQYLSDLNNTTSEESAKLKTSAALEKSQEPKDRNLASAVPDKRSRLQREREMDQSEQRALRISPKKIKLLNKRMSS